MIRYGLLLIAVAACWSAMITSAGAATDRKPNIIYIMADDAGYGDFSCYGQEKFATPNIDRLADEGMKFTDHYSGSTVCAPTRCSLMTGKHTGHCSVRGNREHKPVGQEPMAADTVTVADLLKQAGYATGMFGKWGLGFPGSVSDPINSGFDVFYGYNCQRNAHNYYTTWLYDNDQKVELDGKTYSHDLIMAHALQFIRDNKDQPFFCYLPVTIPHAAMHVPDEYSAPFRKKWPQFDDKIGRYSGPPVKNPIAAFAGMMTKLDQDVGRVMALVKELGLDENTIIMFTSDNGAHQEGGHDPEFFNSNGPFTGYKRDLTEGGIRAPFLERWPGKIKPGTVSDLISAHWDVLPTLCELAGVQPPSDIDGISMVPTFTGQGQQKKHDYLYWEFYERGSKQAVRAGQWKAIRRPMFTGPVFLYNLDEDIAEQNNLADKRPDIAQRMTKLMNEAHVESPLWKVRAPKKKKPKQQKNP
ncbi:arylsulfatase [Planctomycetales bacterium ZRK34]|nr:arylsulfatase [Planctomycetales bacterium ZRK34]